MVKSTLHYFGQSYNVTDEIFNAIPEFKGKFVLTVERNKNDKPRKKNGT